MCLQMGELHGFHGNSWHGNIFCYEIYLVNWSAVNYIRKIKKINEINGARYL